MALIGDFTTRHGLEMAAAYARVDTVSGSKAGIDCTANVYVSGAAFHGGKAYVEQVAFSFVPATEKPIFAQAYAALKTDPRFAAFADELTNTDAPPPAEYQVWVGSRRYEHAPVTAEADALGPDAG